MGSRPPKGFHLRESNESENTNDKINPNIDKFSRNLLSTPSEAQNLHDPYKGLNTDQRNDKIINDFKQAIKNQVEKFEEIGQQDVTTIDDIEEFNRNKRKVDKTSFDELDKERYKNKFLGDLSKKTPEEIYKEIYSNIENAKNADLSPFIDKTLTLEPKEIEYSIEDNDDITRGQFSDLKTEVTTNISPPIENLSNEQQDGTNISDITKKTEEDIESSFAASNSFSASKMEKIYNVSQTHDDIIKSYESHFKIYEQEPHSYNEKECMKYILDEMKKGTYANKPMIFDNKTVTYKPLTDVYKTIESYARKYLDKSSEEYKKHMDEADNIKKLRNSLINKETKQVSETDNQQIERLLQLERFISNRKNQKFSAPDIFRDFLEKTKEEYKRQRYPKLGTTS